MQLCLSSRKCPQLVGDAEPCPALADAAYLTRILPCSLRRLVRSIPSQPSRFSIRTSSDVERARYRSHWHGPLRRDRVGCEAPTASRSGSWMSARSTRSSGRGRSLRVGVGLHRARHLRDDPSVPLRQVREVAVDALDSLNPSVGLRLSPARTSMLTPKCLARLRTRSKDGLALRPFSSSQTCALETPTASATCCRDFAGLLSQAEQPLAELHGHPICLVHRTTTYTCD